MCEFEVDKDPDIAVYKTRQCLLTSVLDPSLKAMQDSLFRRLQQVGVCVKTDLNQMPEHHDPELRSMSVSN
jgi:hypothetical protein